MEVALQWSLASALPSPSLRKPERSARVEIAVPARRKSNGRHGLVRATVFRRPSPEPGDTLLLDGPHARGPAPAAEASWAASVQHLRGSEDRIADNCAGSHPHHSGYHRRLITASFPATSRSPITDRVLAG